MDTDARRLCELEESLLQAGIRKSDRVDQLLAEGFIEFGSSGRVLSRAQVLSSLRAESPVATTATELEAVLLSPDTALVTYRACRHSEPPLHTLRSSVWQRQGGEWRLVFHQGTLSSEQP